MQNFLKRYCIFWLGVTLPAMMLGSGVLIPSALFLLIGLIIECAHKGRFDLRGDYTSPLSWSIAVLLGLTAVSATLAEDKLNALETTFYLYIIFAYGWLLYHFLSQSTQRIEFALKVMIVTIILMSILAWVHLSLWPGLLQKIYMRAEYHPNLDTIILKKPASAFILTIPLTLYAGFYFRKYWQYLAIFATFCSVLLVYLASSRSAMAAIFAMLLIACGMYVYHQISSSRLKLVVIFASLTLAGGIFLYIYFLRSDLEYGVLHLPGWLIDPHRQMIWYQLFLQMMEDFPHNFWLGLGPQGYETLNRGDITLTLTKNIETIESAIASHPHNWILEWAIELGIFNLLVFIGILGHILWQSWKSHDFVQKILIFGIIACFTTAGLFNYSIWSAWWQISIMTILCWGLAIKKNRQNLKNQA